MNYLKSFLNEPGTAEGSSQRLMMVFVIIVVFALIAWLTIVKGAFPEVPASLFDFVQYIVTTLVVGIGIGKGVSAYKTVKGVDNAETPAT